MSKIEWDVRLTFNNIMVALVSLPLILVFMVLSYQLITTAFVNPEVREDIEAIINLKSVNDRFYEVNRLQSSSKKNIIVIPILFTILLLFFILVLLNNAQNEFTYGLGFLTFLFGGLGLAFRQDYKKNEDTLDQLVHEFMNANEKADEVKARLGIKEVYKSD